MMIQAATVDGIEVLEALTAKSSICLPFVIDCRMNKTRLQGSWSIEEFLNFQYYQPGVASKWTAIFVSERVAAAVTIRENQKRLHPGQKCVAFALTQDFLGYMPTIRREQTTAGDGRASFKKAKALHGLSSPSPSSSAALSAIVDDSAMATLRALRQQTASSSLSGPATDEHTDEGGEEPDSVELLRAIVSNASATLPLLVDCRRGPQKLAGSWTIDEFVACQHYRGKLLTKWTALFVTEKKNPYKPASVAVRQNQIKYHPFQPCAAFVVSPFSSSKADKEVSSLLASLGKKNWSSAVDGRADYCQMALLLQPLTEESAKHLFNMTPKGKEPHELKDIGVEDMAPLLLSPKPILKKDKEKEAAMNSPLRLRVLKPHVPHYYSKSQQQHHDSSSGSSNSGRRTPSPAPKRRPSPTSPPAARPHRASPLELAPDHATHYSGTVDTKDGDQPKGKKPTLSSASIVKAPAASGTDLEANAAEKRLSASTPRSLSSSSSSLSSKKKSGRASLLPPSSASSSSPANQRSSSYSSRPSSSSSSSSSLLSERKGTFSRSGRGSSIERPPVERAAEGEEISDRDASVDSPLTRSLTPSKSKGSVDSPLGQGI